MTILFLTCFIFFASGFNQAAAAYEEITDSRPGPSFTDNPSQDTVEVLILLEEQADTYQTAEKARQEYALSALDADPVKQKIAVRSRVCDQLKQKSAVTQAPLLQFLKAEGVEANDIKSFYIVNLVYARVAADLVETILDRDDVADILENEPVESFEPLEPELSVSSFPDIEWNIKHIGAARAWRNFNVDGSGIVIGIIDTGVDLGHPALKTKYRGYDPTRPNSPDHRYNWYDPYRGQSMPQDWHGHGTHVAGIALGSDPGRNNFIGVAPGARWIAARGFNDLLKEPTANTINLLACMQFMLQPTPNPDGTGRPDPGKAPDIIINSWNSAPVCIPIFQIAIQNWRNAEILPVFSAGNSGPDPGTIGMPANYESTFTVGATNKNNDLASFSSRGPGACGPFWKPNLCAPGVNIRSALSEVPVNNHDLPSRARGYRTASGTSMAAPHVAGVAALLKSADPALKTADLEKILTSTADPLTNNQYPFSPNYGFGYGLINAYAALDSVTDVKVTSYLYWQNTTTGALKAWLMNGSHRVDEIPITPGKPDPGWRAKAIHDMNGNGHHDIVFQHEDGRLQVWYMNGLKKIHQAPMINYSGYHGLKDPTWEIKAVYDLNGNRNPDIIWQRKDGELAIWLMDGLKAYRTGRLLHDGGKTSVDSAWEIGAVADLLDNGQPEILWQATGGQFENQLAYWQLNVAENDFTRSGSGRLIQVGGRAEIKSDWSMISALDLLDNGSPEILFQGISGRHEGELAYWEMEKAKRIDGNRLNPSPVDPEWKLVGGSPR